ncbi:MAG: hypothetical protein ABIQ09_10685, partial [Jatrophihabitantaceae bacterium]
HDRALAELLVDLTQCDLKCLVAVECCGHLWVPLSFGCSVESNARSDHRQFLPAKHICGRHALGSQISEQVFD